MKDHPHVNDILQAKRHSTGTQNTYETLTTRASSVMPLASSNMGLSDEENKNLTASEAIYHYNGTEVGKKYREFGNTMLTQSVAIKVNEKTNADQAKLIKDQYRFNLEKQVVDKRKHKLKVCAIFVTVFAVLAAVIGLSLSLVSPESSNNENDDINETPTSAPFSLQDQQQVSFEGIFFHLVM